MTRLAMRCLTAASVMMLGSALSAVAAPADSKPVVPTPDHVVVVVMENHSFSGIIGGDRAPFLSRLARHGASFTHAFAVAHPSQPNYFALFSGSTQSVADDGTHDVDAPTLAGTLRAMGKSFVGYVERGSPRKHNPWESFTDSRDVEQDVAAFPSDAGQLPTVSFVIPNLDDDMHDGSVERGDAWLRQHLGAYAEWCAGTNNLLIVTFDEDDGREGNRIPTVFFGGPVRPGQYAERIDHYTVLRTIEAFYGLPPLGRSAAQAPITEIWAVGPQPPTSP
jgi:phosphatidylinositol-3-phosphatase